jgi:uncharacterized protein (DUF58 family)
LTVSRTQRLVPYLLVTSFTALLGLLLSAQLATLSIVLLSVALLMRYYAELCYYVLHRLRVSTYPRTGTERDDVVVELEVENPTVVPVVTAEFSLQYSEVLRLSGGSRAGVLVVPPRGRVGLRFTFRGRAGTHRIGPLRLVARDPLGLFRTDEVEVGGVFEVSVYPSIEEAVVRRLWLYTRSSGLTKARRAGEGVELYDIRDYHPGDEPRRIAWRVLASQGRLAVKDFEMESYQHVLFVVDSTRDMWFGPYGQTPVEHSVRVVASVARYLARRGYALSAAVFSERGVYLSGRPTAGAQSFRRVYSTLARIEYTGSTTGGDEALGRALEELYTHLPRERTAVFLFTRPTSTAREGTLVRWFRVLESRGHVAYLITPVITSYELADLPPWAQKIYRVKLFEATSVDIERVSKLRKLGVRTVAVGPADLPQRIVSIVESLTPRAAPR